MRRLRQAVAGSVRLLKGVLISSPPMAMLACIHHVSWVKPIDGGMHLCNYCRKVLVKKELYPKFEELGADFQTRWERHERGEPIVPSQVDAAAQGGLTRS